MDIIGIGTAFLSGKEREIEIRYLQPYPHRICCPIGIELYRMEIEVSFESQPSELLAAERALDLLLERWRFVNDQLGSIN